MANDEIRDSNVEIGKYIFSLCQLAEQDRHVTQSNVKIDTEVAGLKTMLESHKLDSIKYLAGETSQLFYFCSNNLLFK